MEGMNLGAMYLIALIVLVGGLLSLVALVSLLLGKFGLARLVFAIGLLASAILAALASLTYLKDVGRFAPQGAGLIFAIMAAVLLLAGWGQFRAAIAFPGRYLISCTFRNSVQIAVGLTVVCQIGPVQRGIASGNMGDLSEVDPRGICRT
jgi:hypothetical protein